VNEIPHNENGRNDEQVRDVNPVRTTTIQLRWPREATVHRLRSRRPCSYRTTSKVPVNECHSLLFDANPNMRPVARFQYDLECVGLPRCDTRRDYYHQTCAQRKSPRWVRL